MAAAGGHTEVLKTLTSKHVKVLVKDNYEALLCLAAKNGRAETVQYLLNQGVPLNATERDQPWSFHSGKTYLDEAIEGGHRYEYYHTINAYFTLVVTFCRDVVDVILKCSKDWKSGHIFGKTTLPLLVEKMPGEVSRRVNSSVVSRCIL